MRNENLIRQDEDMTASEFSADERRDRFEFGNWPEWIGLAFTIFVFWLVLSVTG